MTVCTRQYCRLHTSEQVDLRTQYILTLPRHHGCLAKVWPATEACERAESCEVDECHGSSQSDLTSGLSANFQIKARSESKLNTTATAITVKQLLLVL